MAQRADPFGMQSSSRQDSQPTPDEVAAKTLLLLQRITNQLDLLPRAVASALKAELPKKELAQADRRLLARLLPPALGDLGPRPRVALARDLLEQLRLPDAAVEAAEALRDLEGASDPVKRIGKLLARADGCVIDGIAIRRDGVLRGANLFQFWRV